MEFSEIIKEMNDTELIFLALFGLLLIEPDIINDFKKIGEKNNE